MARTQLSPFEIVEEHFARIATGDGALCLDGGLVDGLPNRPISLDELRCMLLHPSVAFEVRDAALGEIVRRSQCDGDPWTTGVVGIVLPGVRRRIGSMTRAFPPRKHDIEGEALVGLLAGIAGYPKGRERVASTLVWSAARAAHSFVKAECAQQSGVTTGVAPVEPQWPWAHPDLVLARAVEAGVISMDQAQMIGATCVENMTLASYAAQEGIGYEAAKKRHQRALKSLVAWLLEGTVSPKRV